MRQMLLQAFFFWSSFGFASVFEPKVINDSCALGIMVSGCSFQYCDNGIFVSEATKNPNCEKLAPSLNKKNEISLKDWNRLVAEHLSEKSASDRFEKDKNPVPNDSCAVVFYVGERRFLKCDNGYFEKKSKTWREISPSVWNKALSAVIFRSEDNSEAKSHGEP